MNDKEWKAKHFGQTAVLGTGKTAGPLGYVFISIDEGPAATLGLIHMTPKRARKVAKEILRLADQAEAEAQGKAL